MDEPVIIEDLFTNQFSTEYYLDVFVWIGLKQEDNSAFNPYWTTDVLIFNALNMDRKTREIGPLNGISLPDIHMDL